ncbi:polysaccharide deacetylase family protein [Geodermatophilus sp. SYSU D00742]
MRRIDTPLRWRAYLGLARVAGATRRLEGSAQAVALTFDDGPDPESTPRVLDVLAAHDAVATFFCVGQRARRHPDLVRRIVDAGHAVGSHSETHRVGDLAGRAVVADYQAGRRSLEDALGRPVPLFRPPHGWLDWRNASALRRLGFHTRLWTVDPHDYQPGTEAMDLRRGLDGCRAGDVVLLHDALEEAPDGAPSRDVLVDALPHAITGLRARGLELVTLS